MSVLNIHCHWICVLLLCAAFLATSVPTMHALGACPGPNDAFGPCSDTGATTSTGGGTFCGGCANVVIVSVGGNCGGGVAGTGPFDCNNCVTQPKTLTQPHVNTPVGALVYAGCYGSYLLCVSGGGALCGAGCATLCGANPPCVAACIAACATPGRDFCNCAFDGCANDCLPVGAPILVGNLSTCN